MPNGKRQPIRSGLDQLAFIADRLCCLLCALLACLFASGLLVLGCCPDGQCVTNWLQVAIEFWGFIAAIVTFLAAWVAANRKPDLRFIVERSEAQGKSIREVSSSLVRDLPTKSDLVKLHIGLTNRSPEPARFIKIEAKLEFDNEILEIVDDPWRTLITLEMQFIGDFPRDQEDLSGRHHKTSGGDNVVIYGWEQDREVAYCHLSFLSGRSVSKLIEAGVTDVRCTLELWVFCDKRTQMESIPIVAHVQ
jgi:hypothetical protein